MERKIKLVPYRVYKYCPKCPGIMKYSLGGYISISNGSSISGITLTAATTSCVHYPTQSWNHVCDKCGHPELYDKVYPYIDYIEDGELGQN